MQPIKSIERSVYSQNGEDGIIAYLVDRLRLCSRRFLEIGCGAGNENNTTALASAGWTGIAVDGKSSRIDQYRARSFDGVEAVKCTVTPENVVLLLDRARHVDLFSLDIDSYDYHVAAALLQNGFRPKIAVVEFNAALMYRPLSVVWPLIRPYPGKLLYFGCGVEGWRRLWRRFGYSFVTVESMGVNAFFVRNDALVDGALLGVEWLPWADNAAIAARHGPAEVRWELIKNLPFVKIGK